MGGLCCGQVEHLSVTYLRLNAEKQDISVNITVGLFSTFAEDLVNYFDLWWVYP